MPSTVLKAAPSATLRDLQPRNQPQVPLILQVAPLDEGRCDGRPVGPSPREFDEAAAADEFAHAMKEYRQSSGRMFPTWCEVLEVLHGLGYRKPTG
jgi:hypothetical protein